MINLKDGRTRTFGKAGAKNGAREDANREWCHLQLTVFFENRKEARSHMAHDGRTFPSGLDGNRRVMLNFSF